LSARPVLATLKMSAEPQMAACRHDLRSAGTLMPPSLLDVCSGLRDPSLPMVLATVPTRQPPVSPDGHGLERLLNIVDDQLQTRQNARAFSRTDQRKTDRRACLAAFGAALGKRAFW